MEKRYTMARLSVNLNKVALLRNSRHTGSPNVVEFGRIALEAGAKGLTVHPRPDERHIRRTDVHDLAALLAPLRPAIEFNIEGRPTADFLDLVAEIRPEQVTLVPDAPQAFTSDSGWNLSAEGETLKPVVQRLKQQGARVILFMDPDAAQTPAVPATGADGFEIYTGAYAEAVRLHGLDSEAGQAALQAVVGAAQVGQRLGLMVNIGHDLDLLNTPPLIAGAPFIHEASIGHELTGDALRYGFAEAVRRYGAALAV
ncbi:pyridoxine 5'-phosphate synthase [Insolitispirillum peregrinum]|uniref:Pyridoxine 5'-phosphate synthase n=2 Tax=Insolitispirillum peregrinum TaxID=80876 RepID=A0A1N7INR1_9PROT|nr:pyridoxine 5'-phosphate synthase [Insolitispirillum peregrinum]